MLDFTTPFSTGACAPPPQTSSPVLGVEPCQPRCPDFLETSTPAPLQARRQSVSIARRGRPVDFPAKKRQLRRRPAERWSDHSGQFSLTQRAYEHYCRFAIGTTAAANRSIERRRTGVECVSHEQPRPPSPVLRHICREDTITAPDCCFARPDASRPQGRADRSVVARTLTRTAAIA